MTCAMGAPFELVALDRLLVDRATLGGSLLDAHALSIGHLGSKRKQNPENLVIVTPC